MSTFREIFEGRKKKITANIAANVSGQHFARTSCIFIGLEFGACSLLSVRTVTLVNNVSGDSVLKYVTDSSLSLLY